MATTNSRSRIGSEILTVDLEPEVANAVVRALACEIVEEGERFEDLWNEWWGPGDRRMLKEACDRIASLTGVLDQLGWDPQGWRDRSVTADLVAFNYLAGRMLHQADDADRSEDRDAAPYVEAARVFATALAQTS